MQVRVSPYFAAVEAALVLPVQPRLASWDAASHPDQQRLAAYLAPVSELLGPAAAAAPDPLGLRLEVGLRPEVDLLHERDLDNYLLPLARHLALVTGRTLATVSGSKSHSDVSRVGVGPAVRAEPSPNMWTFRGSTNASAQSSLYKEQVRDMLREAEQLPPGPVRLDIAFTVGPARSWLNLWKPTIDALAPLLGAGEREWHPQDGRITELRLHRHLDQSLGHGVHLRIAAGCA